MHIRAGMKRVEFKQKTPRMVFILYGHWSKYKTESVRCQTVIKFTCTSESEKMISFNGFYTRREQKGDEWRDKSKQKKRDLLHNDNKPTEKKISKKYIENQIIRFQLEKLFQRGALICSLVTR